MEQMLDTRLYQQGHTDACDLTPRRINDLLKVSRYWSTVRQQMMCLTQTTTYTRPTGCSTGLLVTLGRRPRSSSPVTVNLERYTQLISSNTQLETLHLPPSSAIFVSWFAESLKEPTVNCMSTETQRVRS